MVAELNTCFLSACADPISEGKERKEKAGLRNAGHHPCHCLPTPYQCVANGNLEKQLTDIQAPMTSYANILCTIFRLLCIIFVLFISVPGPHSVLTNRNLDSLCREAFAQGRALDYARKLLRTIYLEDFAKDTSKYGGAAGIETCRGRASAIGPVRCACSGLSNVDKVHLESAYWC